MANNLTNYKIFIASPRGLEQERECFKNTILDFNTFDANHRNVHFSPIGWEITLGGIGRPQSQINEEIKECDYFILLLHDKWGTPPNNPTSKSKFTSGTEEEFYTACDCYKSISVPMQQIVLFFKAVNERQLNDPGDELKKVLAFRAQREKEKDFLYETFDTPENFKDIFRRHLSAWVRNHETGISNKSSNFKITLTKEDFNPLPYTIDFNSIESINKILDEAEKFASDGKILEAEIRFSQVSVRSEAPKPMIRYARFLRKIGQPQRALELLKKALDKAILIDDQSNIAYAYRQTGRAQEMCGDFIGAIENYSNSLELYRKISDEKGIARSLRDLGMVLKKKGSYEEAINYLNESLVLYEKLNDDNGIATAIGCLGLIHKTKGDLVKAEESYLKALKIHEKVANKEAKAIVLSNLGVIYRIQKKLPQAKELHKESLHVFLELNNRKGASREYSNLGVILRLEGKLSQSKEMHKESLIISEQLGNIDGMAIQYGNLGMIARLEGDYKVSEEYHRKSLEISSNIGDKVGQSIQYKSIGILYRERKEFDKALDFIKRALEIDLESKNLFGASITYFEIAKTYFELKDKVKSIEYAVLAIEIFKKLKMENDIKLAEELIQEIENL